MAKLCNAARVFFRAQPGGTGRISPNPIVTHRLQSLLCCAPPASFRLKSATVVDAKQVLTDLVRQPVVHAVRLQPFTATGHEAKMIYYRSARLQWITSSIENSP
jgi:hypothetical protein